MQLAAAKPRQTNWRLLACIWLALAYALRRWLQKRKFNALPVARCIKKHPVLGHFGHMLLHCERVPKTANRPDIMPVWTQAAAETRKEGLFYQSAFHWLIPCWRNMVVVHDVDLVKKLLSKEKWGLFRKGRSYTIAHDLIGAHSLLAEPDSELWRRQRRVFNAAFRRSSFDAALAPAVREAVAAMTASWKEGSVVEFYDAALELTIGVLGKFAFGTDFEGPRVREAFTCVLQRMTTFGRNPLLFLTRRLPTAANREYWSSMRTIEEALTKSIEGKAKGQLGEDLVSQILKVADSEGGALGSGLVLENLKTFLFAGHDTTASALSWAMFLLGTHPEAEEKLLAELAEAREGASCDELDRLPYLEAVLKETLRLYPSAGFTREPLSDQELGGHLLPRGVEVFVFPYITHRNEGVFKDFASFSPERWLGPQEAAAESLGWMPFSLGLRNCIGSQLAKLEMKLALKQLLPRWRFRPAEEQKPRVTLYMTLVPNAMPLVVSRREAAT